MVSGTLVDTLFSPSLALRNLFSKAASEGKTDDFPAFVRDYFSSLFAGDALEQIPLLNTTRPPSSHAPISLFRFRAMVQDTSCSPEMYLSSFKGAMYGGWGLESEEQIPDQLELDTSSNNLKEREVIWAVSIPGEGHWCESSGSIPGTVAPDARTNPTVSELQRPHKYPIPDSGHVAAQLKVYDDSAQSLKPTSVHEFVGMLAFESTHSDFAPETTVPTLHVLFHHQLPKTVYSLPSSESTGSQAYAARDTLIDWLSSEALGCDRDAAEWVLLSCISSVESRDPPLFPMSIVLSELSSAPVGDVPTISLALSELLPLYFLLPLTLNILNERSFLPESKDEDLHAGVLQVPDDATFLVTETGIVEGNLVEKGIENVNALREVAKLQTLPYKFPFSQYSFPADINFIALTEGKKSLFLDSAVIIPLRPDASTSLYNGRDSIKWPSPEALSSFREYIVRSKSSKVSVGEELSEYIKNEFVQDRQKNKSITPDDLIRQMTIARLISRSRLEGQMSMESWNLARALDARRKSRIS